MRLRVPRVFFRKLAKLAEVVWELPQTSLGALTFGAVLAARQVTQARTARGRVFVKTSMGLGVSLGHFVFYSEKDSPFVPVGPENADHEYGHARQSRRFGPAYLPLVGLPSVMRVVYAIGHRMVLGRRWAGYYRGYPERQADKLGGVDRTHRPVP